MMWKLFIFTCTAAVALPAEQCPGGSCVDDEISLLQRSSNSHQRQGLNAGEDSATAWDVGDEAKAAKNIVDAKTSAKVKGEGKKILDIAGGDIAEFAKVAQVAKGIADGGGGSEKEEMEDAKKEGKDIEEFAKEEGGEGKQIETLAKGIESGGGGSDEAGKGSTVKKEAAKIINDVKEEKVVLDKVAKGGQSLGGGGALSKIKGFAADIVKTLGGGGAGDEKKKR